MAYVRLDKISASAHIESIIATEDLVNGQFLALGELQPDGEAVLAEPSGDKTKELVFHSSVPLTYENGTNELDYKLKAGKVGRGYVLITGDIVSITIEDGVIGNAVKGAIVEPDAGGFKVSETPESVTGFHGKIIDIETDMIAGQMAVIRIVR